MTDLRANLASQPKLQKQIGLALILVGLLGFFASMGYFGLFGTRIQYSGLGLAKELVALSFLFLGLFGFGYAVGGKRAAFSFLRGWALAVVVAALLGLIRTSLLRR